MTWGGHRLAATSPLVLVARRIRMFFGTRGFHLGGAMRWLALCAGLALAGLASAQSWSDWSEPRRDRFDAPGGATTGAPDPWRDGRARWPDEADPGALDRSDRPWSFEPSYELGYERPGVPEANQPWLDPATGAASPVDAVPVWRDDRPEASRWTSPADADRRVYRFRGDPPSSPGGTELPDADGAFRFRPLTERERERAGTASGWRPLDEESSTGARTRRERSSLFESMIPGDHPAGRPLEDWPRR
jgi:hypothetical protein